MAHIPSEDEVKLYKLIFLRSAKHEAKLDARVRRLESALTKTHREGRHARNDAQKAAERYGKALCLRLCEMLQDKLPIELREMVYGYIDTSEKLHVFDGHPYFDPFEYRHYLDPGYVGSTTLAELTDHLHRTMCFSCDISYPEYVLHPAGNYYPRLHYVVKNLAPSLGVVSYVEILLCPEKESRKKPIKDQVLLNDLETLFKFRVGTTITLRRSVPRRSEFVERHSVPYLVNKDWSEKSRSDMCTCGLDRILERISPIVPRLIEAGYKVRYATEMCYRCLPGYLYKHT